MNHIWKEITRQFFFSSLLVMMLITSCSQQAPTTSLVSATSLPPTAETITRTVPAPSPTITPTVPAPTPTSMAANHYNRGFNYQRANNLELAIEEFSQTIELDPQYTDALFERGRTYVVYGRNYDLAIADWTQVIELDPEYIDAYFLRAFAYDDSGDYEKAIADYAKVIELDPQFAEAYYWRGIGSAIIGVTENALSDLEKALALGLDPEMEQDAKAALEELGRLVAGKIVFDGDWAGNTSQGEVITFEIEDNAVVSFSVGFQILGCESFSPIAALSGREPLDLVEENRFWIVNSLSMDGSFATVIGNFTSSSTAIGTLEIACEDGLTTSWTASKSVRAERTPTPGDLDKIPRVEISTDLYSREDGSDNFDEYTSVVVTNGDWYLLRYFGEWVIPIPSGWTSVATSDGAYFLFGKEGTEGFSIEIDIGQVCEEAVETGGEAIAQIEAEIRDDSTAEVLKKEIVDDEKGYLSIAEETETGTRSLRLLIISEYSGSCFHYLSAKTDEKDWDDFFPVIHAIVENWFDLSNNFLGVALPESLWD